MNQWKCICLSRGKAYDASRRIDDTRNSVDGNDVARAFIPRTVFPPVCGGYFFPRVVESAVKGIDPHRM